MPRTRIVYIPGEVPLAVLMVRTAFPVPPESNVTWVGFRVRVGLAPLLGDIETLKLTVPVKPPMLVSVRVALMAEP